MYNKFKQSVKSMGYCWLKSDIVVKKTVSFFLKAQGYIT